MKPTIAFLYSLQKIGMKFGLQNIRALLHAVGDPDKKIKTVHIAGTNGKGSTSSMIAAIYTAAGYKVGLYTSPHLVKFNERIRINGTMISNNDVIRLTKKHKPHILRLNATFFEATTSMAFKYFAEKKVDIAIIETGLGGRLDATNVLRPLVSVITSIGFEHTEYLGKTIQSIAREKSGIVKRKVPVVIGSMDKRAAQVIASTAKRFESQIVDSSKKKLARNMILQLIGKHQQINAKTAIEAVRFIKKTLDIDDTAIRDGLKNTIQLTGLRARFEFLPGHPDVVLDVAHNPDGVKELVRELIKQQRYHCVIIFAVMKDKDYSTMLRSLKRVKPIIIATQSTGDRALPSMQLFSKCKEMGIRCFHAANAREAILIGEKKAGAKRTLVATGSHFLIGEIIPILEKKS